MIYKKSVIIFSLFSSKSSDGTMYIVYPRCSCYNDIIHLLIVVDKFAALWGYIAQNFKDFKEQKIIEFDVRDVHYK